MTFPHTFDSTRLRPPLRADAPRLIVPLATSLLLLCSSQVHAADAASMTTSPIASANAVSQPTTGMDGNKKPKVECRMDEVRKDLVQKSPTLLAAIKRVFSSHCGTFETVVRRMGAKAPAGRKLEPPRGLDITAARAELGKARSDPGFQRDLANETEGVTDTITRKLLEIALLDDYDFRDARDLLAYELEQELTKGNAS